MQNSLPMVGLEWLRLPVWLMEAAAQDCNPLMNESKLPVLLKKRSSYGWFPAPPLGQ
jgi:hypothetical protein